MTYKESNFRKELSKWFGRWQSRAVVSKCLDELIQRDKEFIRQLKDYITVNIRQSERKRIKRRIDKLSGYNQNDR